MHNNSLLMFKKHGVPIIKLNMKILEISPSWDMEYRNCVPNNLYETAYWSPTEKKHFLTEYQTDFPDSSFDVVIAGQVIEHVRKPWLWIPELARITRKLLIIICPISWGYHPVPVDCWRIYPEGMVALFEESNLSCKAYFESLDGKVTDTIAIGAKDQKWLGAKDQKWF